MKAILFLLAISFVLANSVKVFDTVVTNGNGPLPIATFDSAAISETSYVFFGGAVNGTFSNRTHILTRISKSSAVWSEIFPQTVPSARWFPAMATVRDDSDNVYACMYGGSQFIPPFTFTVSADFFLCFNGSSLQWIDLSSIPGSPGPRSGVSMSGKGANAYIFGGINAFFQTQRDIYRFNINTMQWTNLTSPTGPNPPPRQIGNTAILCDFHNCKLVLTSGEQVSFTPGLTTSQINDTWEFSLSSHTWTNVTDAENMVVPPRNNHECFIANNNQQKGFIFGGQVTYLTLQADVQTQVIYQEQLATAQIPKIPPTRSGSTTFSIRNGPLYSFFE